MPGVGNPVAWDRYAYSSNNPVSYNDPDGHTPLLVTALIGAGIAAAVDYGWQVVGNLQSGQSFDQALLNVDEAEIVGAAVAGGIAGLTLGLGTAALAAVGGVAATTELIAMPVAAIAGGAGNALGGQAGALAEAGVRQLGNPRFDKNEFYTDAFNAGFLNADEFMWDFGTGAILGAGSQAVTNLTAPSNAAKYRFYDQLKDLEGNIVQVPQNSPARLPGAQIKPIIKGPVAGLMRRTSDWGQEIISRGVDRFRATAR